MPRKSHNESVSIRIPLNYYEKLKNLAENNKRPLSSELVIILDEYLASDLESPALRRLKALKKISGIVKNLPKGNYGQTVDDVLYGDR